jgi:formylglycine-generating enzyme required for sulfatase activity
MIAINACYYTNVSFNIPVQLVSVQIENPDSCQISVFSVSGGRAICRPVESQSIALELPPGYYHLVASRGSGRANYPLPLVPDLLANNQITVTVRRPPDLVDGFGYVPEGWCLQGDALGVGQEDERPAHLAHISGFYISKYEVTNEEYAAFLNDVGKADERWLNIPSHKCMIKRDEATGKYTTTAPKLPVVTVTWYGAVEYCTWLTKKTGFYHRLPTEAEWEKAARGPQSFLFSYGNVYGVAKANQESGKLVEVGKFEPNGYGLYDLTGNAFEWVQDTYDPRAYFARVNGKLRDPCNNGAPDGEVPNHRILRGGSFVLDGIFIRNSFRMKYSPTVKADDIGFRIVRPEKKGG